MMQFFISELLQESLNTAILFCKMREKEEFTILS